MPRRPKRLAVARHAWAGRLVGLAPVERGICLTLGQAWDQSKAGQAWDQSKKEAG
jgi:hypothetical protein